MYDKSLTCTVIVPTYNRSMLLRHTLESLTMQSLPSHSFEVIVCDDGSSDDSAAVAARYADRLRLRYLFQPDDGFRAAAARNLGIRGAEAPICVFVDSGMLLHTDCLAMHLSTHRASDEPVAVLGYNYGHRPDARETEGLESEIDVDNPTDAIERLATMPEWHDIREVFYAKYSDDFHDLPAPWVVYWGGNVSAATDQVRAVGMFDEAFRSWGAEDLDFGYRLHRAGARFVLNRRANAIYLPHDKDGDLNKVAAGANYRYMAGKYRTPITGLLALFPGIGPFTMNDVIRERGLPQCADYLAGQAGSVAGDPGP